MIMLILFATLNILGSLGIFLFGMKVMSEGIQKVAGDRLRSILSYMTQNRFAGVLTGFITTCLVQSSSATTVMLISFVNAGLITLVQSISVIMGANIGTTITGWLVSIFGFKFKITSIALPAIGIGLPLIFSKLTKRKNIGEIFVGFGLLFLGLKFLKESVPNIKDNPEVLGFLSAYTDLGFLSLAIFIFAGIILTVIVQSSSAAMAITITMAFNGWIDFKTAAALVLGQNIGTTITAYLASINANYHAKRTARAHLIINIVGVIWVILIFNIFIEFIDYIIPGNYLDPNNIPIHLSMFHTMFNIINVVVLIWFIPQIASIVKKMVKPTQDQEVDYKLEYFSTNVQPTPEIALLEAKKEVAYMSSITNQFLSDALNTINHGIKDDSIEKARKTEILTDQMQVEISNYLAECTKHELSVQSAQNASDMIRIVNELESISDSIFNLFLISKKLDNNMLSLEMNDQIQRLYNKVNEFINWNHDFLAKDIKSMSLDDLNKSIQYENEIDDMRNKFIKASSNRLTEDSNVESELIFIDIIKHLEHIGDFSLNISQALED
jgi:phosphate:Na+ symporter